MDNNYMQGPHTHKAKGIQRIHKKEKVLKEGIIIN